MVDLFGRRAARELRERLAAQEARLARLESRIEELAPKREPQAGVVPTPETVLQEWFNGADV